jgi:hypothetical protein
VDSWGGGFLKLHAAVSVKPAGGEEVFGIVRVSAHALVDRSTRMVTLFNFSQLQIGLPNPPDHGQKYTADLGRFLPAGTKHAGVPATSERPGRKSLELAATLHRPPGAPR